MSRGATGNRYDVTLSWVVGEHLLRPRQPPLLQQRIQVAVEKNHPVLDAEKLMQFDWTPRLQTSEEDSLDIGSGHPPNDTWLYFRSYFLSS